ncbi:polysaccharide lyase family 14 protein [Phlegmacium glaucopus]|nr:polysaccharide lyase family 14 protein [Phlegmacium glaucopus]
MDDLTPFGVSHFPDGGKNLQIVTENPAKANVIPMDGSNAASTKSDDSVSILQLFFPAGSIDPAQEPQGGAEFYASPLDISDAQNVTLMYSVFFPADFDWVLAGKLPGLYGGHTRCSGGNPAVDCFSTRLMWRKKGAGELYLYAPKEKQTEALCSDPESICDAAYGLSIGRGSFTWAAGDWTRVQQTVVLNTPGMQDGSFTLDINGRRVIDRADVLYRDELADDSGDDESRTPSPKKAATTFFGGHSDKYATPRDQYIWFKDFALAYNS